MIKNRLLSLIDSLDQRLCDLGIIKPADWQSISTNNEKYLYAGRLSRQLPQFRQFYGITPFLTSSKNIKHDATERFPIKENTVSIFQSEDVFEHIEYTKLYPIFDEIYRILEYGGLFRLSVPDYRCPIYDERCIKDSNGQIIHDPGGGGDYKNGNVINGGHLWFPTIEKVIALFNYSNFNEVRYLQYYDQSSNPVIHEVDHSICFVQRSVENDIRAKQDKVPISIIVDAYKT